MTTATALPPIVKPIFPPTPTMFLRSWFSGCPADQLLELRAIRAEDKSITQRFFTLDAAAELVGAAFSLTDTHDCYFGACPRVRPQGRKEDVTHAPGFWADLDFKRFADGEAGALRKLATFPLPPSWIVATGGGYHLYWKLNMVEKWDAKMQGRLRGIVRMLDADPAATDRSRVLRLPGTFNHKYPDCCQVRIIKWDTD